MPGAGATVHVDIGRESLRRLLLLLLLPRVRVLLPLLPLLLLLPLRVAPRRGFPAAWRRAWRRARCPVPKLWRARGRSSKCARQRLVARQLRVHLHVHPH